MSEDKPFIITVWAVHEGDTDMRSGNPAWFFMDKADADLCAIRRGWWGGKATISEQSVLAISGMYFWLAKSDPIRIDYGPDDVQAEKNAAIAKLTDRERELLGIH